MKDELPVVALGYHEDIINETYESTHSVSLAFTDYSKLVERLVRYCEEKAKTSTSYNPIYFTALCVPPFMWFNWDNQVAKIEHISRMNNKSLRPNAKWFQYIRFAYCLKTRVDSMYRCLLVKDSRVAKSKLDRLPNLPHLNIVNCQLRANVVFKKSDLLEPLNIVDIRTILADEFEHSCYRNVKKAFLILNENSEIVDDLPRGYDCKSVREFLKEFQSDRYLWMWKYTQPNQVAQHYPEDFFLFGSGETKRTGMEAVEAADWHFGLAARPTSDMEHVRLSFLSNGVDVPLHNGEYEEDKIPTMPEICEFVRSHLTKALYTEVL